MSAQIAKGTKIKLKFDDGHTLEWQVMTGMPLVEAINELQLMAAAFDRETPISGSDETL